VESKHQLGGTGTTGLVSHWLGGRNNDGTWAVGGIFRELSEDSSAKGIAVIPNPSDYSGVKYAPHGMYKGQLLAGIPFDPFMMAPYLEEVLLSAGVDIIYETWAVATVREGSRLTHVVISGKEGLRLVPAKVFVDATGDADLAAKSGCSYAFGDADGKAMAISLMIHVENVNEKELMEYVIGEDDPRFKNLMTDLRSRGVNCYEYPMIIFVKMTRDGYFMINGRPLSGIDGTSTESRTNAYVTERRKIHGTIELFRKHWPGCKNITLRAVASNLGVRESRRIDAEGYFSVNDIIEEKTVPDTIGFTAYGWDINQGSGDIDPHSLVKPPVIPIPYSVMVPKGVENLICPGRAINCERVVLGPMRVQAPIMAMGEAAGIAAAEVVTSNIRFADIDTDKLRSCLSENAAIVD